MLRWWVVGLVSLAGCFSDVPPGGSGGTGSTSGPSCTPGEVLCACRADDTCDMGLACVPEGCIPDACNPGEAMCTCLQPGDVCAQGWTCIEGLCRDEPITTDGMTSMPSQTDTTGEPPATSTTIQPGTTDMSAGTTAVAETGEQESGDVECGEEPACADCALCASQTDCKNQFEACMDDEVGCMGPLMCIHGCLAGNPDQWAACIETCGCGDGNMPLQSLVECTVAICDAVCEMDLPCSNGG